MKKQLFSFLALLLLAALALCACGGTTQDTLDVQVIKDENGNVYATSADGKTFLFYYPANESTDFMVPEGIVTVAENAFLGTTSLKRLSFASSVKKILCNFSGSSLEKITIPKTVESFVPSFSDCLSLKELTIASASNDSDRVSINNSGVEILTLPSSLTAFSNPWVFDATAVREIRTYNETVVRNSSLEALCDKTVYMPTGLEKINVDQWIGIGESGKVCGLYFSDNLKTLDLRGTISSGGAQYIVSVPSDIYITYFGEPTVDANGNNVYDGFLTVIIRE